MIYAQLDDNKICTAISDLSEEVNAENLIALTTYDTFLIGKRWNGETWEAVTPKETAPTVPEEKISLEERLKNLEQGQIATQEAIATMYEDHTKRKLQIDETLATIYETLTDKGQENEKTK